MMVPLICHVANNLGFGRQVQSFQEKDSMHAAPSFMSIGVEFHDPQFIRSQGQWVRNFIDENGVNSLCMWYRAC